MLAFIGFERHNYSLTNWGTISGGEIPRFGSIGLLDRYPKPYYLVRRHLDLHGTERVLVKPAFEFSDNFSFNTRVQKGGSQFIPCLRGPGLHSPGIAIFFRGADVG